MSVLIFRASRQAQANNQNNGVVRIPIIRDVNLVLFYRESIQEEVNYIETLKTLGNLILDFF